jgi:hypothetical protein
MEQWNDGMCKKWKNGMMEYWNIEMMGNPKKRRRNDSL